MDTHIVTDVGRSANTELLVVADFQAGMWANVDSTVHSIVNIENRGKALVLIRN